jgi:DNA-binding MarR family transcriptional regulator
VIRAKAIGILILSSVLTLPIAGQNPAPGGNAPRPQQQKGNKPNQNQGRIGGWLWLRAHKDLPPDQQEKALENDPEFKKLPPQRQAELKEGLHKFISLTPQQRERALRQREIMASLTPEQRAQVRDAHQKLKGLPTERRVMVHKALRNLVKMSPQERQQVFESDKFKSTFSDQEQTILKNLAEINLPLEGENPSR